MKNVGGGATVVVAPFFILEGEIRGTYGGKLQTEKKLQIPHR
jgi:hypothetical protein